MKDLKDSKIVTTIAYVSALLVLFISGVAFVLSYEAIRQLAVSVGVATKLAWLFPLVIDSCVIVFSVNVLRALLMGEKPILSYLFIIVFTAVSIAFNLKHSSGEFWGGMLAVIPPVALVLSFETLMGQIRTAVKRSHAINSIPTLENIIGGLEEKRHKLETAVTKLDEQYAQKSERLEEKYQQTIAKLEQDKNSLRNEIQELTAKKKTNDMPLPMAAMLVFVGQQPNATYREIGSFIGRSPATVKAYADKLIEAGMIKKNGNGFEVLEN